MTPQKKLILLLFVLFLPYMALVMYFALSGQGGAVRIPYWFAYFGISYFLFCMIVGAAASRKWSRNAPKPPVTKKQSILAKITQLWSLYLVVVWSGLFGYGVRDVIRGELPLSRAIPAGLFLLMFVGIFSWALYRSFQARKPGV